MADHISGRLITQQQRQSIDQNGFAGAGFAGQQIQSRRELHHHVVNDRVVLQPQLEEHREVLRFEFCCGENTIRVHGYQP